MQQPGSDGAALRASAGGAADALLLASRALVAVAARSLADSDDVTLPQFRALVVLSDRGALRVSQLAAVLDIRTSTATRLCDRLVRKGLVTRTASEQDRRSVDVTLTRAGRRLVERVHARRRRDLAQIVERMPSEAQAQSIAVLEAFARAAGDLGIADPFGWGGEAASSRG